MLFDDFDMMYDDWMIDSCLEIRKTYVVKDILQCVEKKYPDTGDEEANKKYDGFYNKALAVHQKLSMMMFAEYNFRKAKAEFEGTQNMEIPALYGMGRTMLLFYFESMVVFARNALDVAATIYSDLLLDKREDSFNNFSKKVMKSSDLPLENLKKYFEKNRDNGLSAFRLLCGSEKGRALRDIIIHQTNVRLEYHEYKENSEKEHLLLVLKDMEPVDLDWFVPYFIDEVEEIFREATGCCDSYLRNKAYLISCK